MDWQFSSFGDPTLWHITDTDSWDAGGSALGCFDEDTNHYHNDMYVDYALNQRTFDIQDLKASTIKAGFTLKMRLPIYPEYIRKISGFLPKKLKHKITSQVDNEGFVREDKF